MASTLDSPFGERLRADRAAALLTQEELAERTGLSLNAVSALECGDRRRPCPSTVQALAEGLDTAEER